MDKPSFFRLCDRVEVHVHQLQVVVRGRYRSLDHYAVFLTGSSWCLGGLTSQELYCPLPGRQHEDWQKCKKAAENERAKYARWLEEWRKS